jgi:beta-glucosidase
VNSGKREGDEVVQLYVHNNDPEEKLPLKKLVRFKRISLIPGKKQNVVFKLPVDGETLGYWNVETDEFVLHNTKIDVMVGSSSEDIRLSGSFKVGAVGE